MVPLALITGLILGARGKLNQRHQDPYLHRLPTGKSGHWHAATQAFARGAVMRWHLNGVVWYDHIEPPLVHCHWAQTCEITRTQTHVDICACGAQRFGVWGDWMTREDDNCRQAYKEMTG